MFKFPSMTELGIAAGFLFMFLFGILFVQTEHPAVLIAGCGGSLVLLIVSLVRQYQFTRTK